jgi:anaerobic magnesium-protoporphyrin IX monomethyl ester cyclase
MDLLLTHGYFLNEDPKELQIMKPYPLLGILYLSSFLKARGYDVEIFDSTFQSRADLYRCLQTSGPGLLGIYSNLMTRSNVVEILQTAKTLGWDVILGGPEPANYSEEYLTAGADAVVVGEGELVLEEILARRRCIRDDSFTGIHGIVFRDEKGVTRQSGSRNLIPDLDSLPWPDRQAIDIDSYLKAWRTAHGKGSVSLITARGCPYHCRWCSHSVYGKTHRRRTPKSVADEIEWIRERYSPEMLWIADDVFTIHAGWLFEFAREMKDRHLTIPFECITRADRLNQPVSDALAELECYRVWIGSESGSQRILDAMERNVTVEEVQSGISLCRARGIQTGLFLMWGYPGEELSDIEATIEHVKKSAPDVFLTTVAYPIKGTDYFKEVSSILLAPEKWEKASDRDYKVRGRRSRHYYRYADQLLKNELALHQANLNGMSDCSYEVQTLQKEIVKARNGLAQSQTEVEA